MTIKRIKVKETTKVWFEFEGTIEEIFFNLQESKEKGYDGIEAVTRGYDGAVDYYLYKFREETDKEYEKRMKLLEKEKADKAKAKERKLKQLRKDLASLSGADKELLGL
jgi:hypothetical protein